MPASAPAINQDLSADVRQLERTLAQCAQQIEMVKACQEEMHAQAR